MTRRGSLWFALLLVAVVLFWVLWPASQEAEPERPKKLFVPSPPKRSLSPKHLPAPTLAQDPEGPLSLSGQVIYQDGTAAPGALVYLDANPPRQTTSDEQGWFFFEGLFGRTYSLAASLEDQAAGPFEVQLSSLTDPVEMRLHPAPSLVVTVVDAEHLSPVSGALVSVEDANLQSATTNTQGKATFKALGDSYFFTLFAKAQGYSPQTQEIRIEKVGREFATLYLQKGSAVSGLVLTPQQHPIEGATVFAVPYGEDPQLMYAPKAMTDASGRFTIEGVSKGVLYLYATHNNAQPTRSASFFVDGEGLSEGHVMLMAPGARLSGQVRSLDGAPLPFAQLTLWYDNEEYAAWDIEGERSAFCDKEGGFAFTGLHEGELVIEASAEGFVTTKERVLLRADEVTTSIITLQPGEEIGGVVVSDQGAPLSDIYVSLEAERPDEEVYYPDARTDIDGRFLFRGLANGRYRLVVYDEEAFQWAALDPRVETIATTGEHNAKIVLPRYGKGAITGKVVFAEGGVPASFLVASNDARGRFSNPDGSFLLTSVSAGDIDLSIEGEEFLSEYRSETVEAGKTLDVGTIEVSRGQTISGVVQDEQGRPVSGAEVSLTYEGIDDHLSTQSDANGRFTLHNGNNQEQASLQAVHPIFGSSALLPIALASKEVSLTVELHPGGAVYGVVLRKGRPIKAMVALYIGEERLEEVITGPDGVFYFDKLSKGTYTLLASRDTHQSPKKESATQQALTIQEQELQEVTLSLLILPSLRVELTPSPPPGAAFEIILFSKKVAPQSASGLWEEARKLNAREEYISAPSNTVTLLDVIPGEGTLCLRSGASEEEAFVCQPLLISEQEEQQVTVVCGLPGCAR